jgi:hypothetical protein
VGVPALGNPAYGIRVTSAFPNSGAILVLGAAPAELPLPGGCTLHVSFFPFPLSFPTPTDGSGTGTVTLPIPAAPPLAGFQLFAQYAVADPGGPFGNLALTGGLRIVLNVN